MYLCASVCGVSGISVSASVYLGVRVCDMPLCIWVYLLVCFGERECVGMTVCLSLSLCDCMHDCDCVSVIESMCVCLCLRVCGSLCVCLRV